MNHSQMPPALPNRYPKYQMIKFLIIKRFW